MNETHADTAFRLVQSVEVIGHAMRDAIALGDWPAGSEPERPTVSIRELEPDVLDLIARPQGESLNWTKRHGANEGKATAHVAVTIAGVTVNLHSRMVGGTLSTEFVRSER